MKPILVILPFHSGDFQLALGLLEWIRDLGGHRGTHELLILGAHRSLNVEMLRLKEAALSTFISVVIDRAPGIPDESWPKGANIMFRHACELVQKRHKMPFLWMEPDCVPMKAGWLDAIATEYEGCGHPFMGGIRRQTSNPALPQTYLPGCSMYPADAFSRLRQHWEPLSSAWDVSTAVVTVPHAVKSFLFYEWWGMNGKPPIFKLGRRTTDPVEVMVPDQIPKEAVFFHRSKDGSLIRCLREIQRIPSIHSSQPKPIHLENTVSCYHSGDLGDIIYSLLFCKTLGNIRLIIGPDPTVLVREPMTLDRFNWLAPLLRFQPWIKSVEYAAYPPPKVDFNLNDFRRTWFSTGWFKKGSLAQAYAEHFKRDPLKEDEPWLISDPHIDYIKPVVISRSLRYQNKNFPWELIASQYAGQIRFIGLEEEYRKWVDEFGDSAVFHPVKHAFDVSMSIAGSSLFIGNQSFPMAVALGLGVKLIQECWPDRSDCILNRPNALFYQQPEVLQLPKIDKNSEYLIQPTPKEMGLYHLGPMAGGAGLGDTIMIQPLARALGNRALMHLPSRMAKFAFLFRNACPVTITNKYPVYHYQSGVLQSEGLLRKFNIQSSHVPVVELGADDVSKAKHAISQYPNPIVICPTCSKVWAHARQAPPTFWKPVIAELKKRFTVLQFGREDYSTLDGAVRMPFLGLEELAAHYAVIGNYVGVDTGDYHLMIAVGGRVIVAQQDPWTEAAAWSYNLPKRVAYAKLSNPLTVLDAIRRLPL